MGTVVNPMGTVVNPMGTVVNPMHKIPRQHKSQASVAYYTSCRLVTLDAQCLSR